MTQHIANWPADIKWNLQTRGSTRYCR